VGILLFEFSKFYPSDYQHGRDFVADLDRFLGQLPAGWPYGVEIRNKNFLHPEYFAVLKEHNVTQTKDRSGQPDGKPTGSSVRKAAVLSATRPAGGTPPGSEIGACVQRGNPGTRENLPSPWEQQPEHG